jgi:hypothetical protein
MIPRSPRHVDYLIVIDNAPISVFVFRLRSFFHAKIFFFAHVNGGMLNWLFHS